MTVIRKLKIVKNSNRIVIEESMNGNTIGYIDIVVAVRELAKAKTPSTRNILFQIW